MARGRLRDSGELRRADALQRPLELLARERLLEERLRRGSRLDARSPVIAMIGTRASRGVRRTRATRSCPVMRGV